MTTSATDSITPITKAAMAAPLTLPKPPRTMIARIRAIQPQWVAGKKG